MPNYLYQGKVRDTCDLGVGELLKVATDLISAFWFDMTRDIISE